MGVKKNMAIKIRGWFPKDPKIGISNSTKSSGELDRWVGLPYSALSVLMIVASLLSVILGAVMVLMYVVVLPLGPQGDYTLYSGLYIGILSLAAFAVGVYSSVLLLARKNIGRAVAGMVVILGFGLLTLLIPFFEGLPAQSGLVFALPMIASSVTALFITARSMNNQTTKRATQKTLPTLRERLFVGLGAAGGGLTVMGVVFYFVPTHPFKVYLVVLVGVPLLAAAFLVKKTQKTGGGVT
jgi:hypothetical protein